MRRPKACAACRARRRKCVVQPGHDRCDYCALHAIDCVHELPRGGWYEKRAILKEQNGSPSKTQGSDSGARSSGADEAIISPSASTSSVDHQSGSPVLLPDMALRLELVDAYFDYVHDQFHSIFHRPTFVEDAAQDLVPESLLFGILAMGARFSTNPALSSIEPRERGRRYFEEAERRLNLRDISLRTVQLSILLGAYATGDGDTEAENLCYSLACRTAQLIGLPHRPAPTALEREIDIRVWWSLCMIDVWSSTAVKLPRLLPPDGDGAPLPMDDLPFLYLPRVDSGNSPSTPGSVFERRSPLIGQMVLLNRILLEVNDFNKRCVAEPPPSAAELETGVQTLVGRMDAWLAALPADVRDTDDNLLWFNSHGLGRIYAAVYLGYYHFGQLLYYQFLHSGGTDSGEVTPAVAEAGSVSLSPAVSPALARVYSDRCKYHSARLCDMIYRAVYTPGSDVRYHMVAHVLVIASTVQIHTLLFSDDENQIAEARGRLEKNFEIILLLRDYWPALDRIMARLRLFHETCQVNMGSSFVLDRWMLQFLVAFGGPMDEKPARPQRELDAFYRLDGII